MAPRNLLLAEAARLAIPVVEPVEVVEEEDSDLDDDLWEAVDLMETSVKILKKLNERRHSQLITNHVDDLQQFIDYVYGVEVDETPTTARG